MRRILVTLTLMGTTALAGGNDYPPKTVVNPNKPITVKATVAILTAGVSVEPGQTWILEGISYQKQPIKEELVLGNFAKEWQGGRYFESKSGTLLIVDEVGELFAVVKQREKEDAQICLALNEGKTISGVLISGSLDGFDKLLNSIAMENDRRKTKEQIGQSFAEIPFPLGSCTLKRK